MNATFAKNQMSHLAPAGLGNGQTDGYGDRVAPRGLGRKIADTLAYLVAMPRRRAVLDELRMLTDRELADIGVARSELKRVFDPAFSREQAVRSGAYRSMGINV